MPEMPRRLQAGSGERRGDLDPCGSKRANPSSTTSPLCQGLLDDASSRSGSTTASVQEKLSSDTPDRAFMDDFLLTVLEQKDRLADELHSLNNECVLASARRQSRSRTQAPR